MLKQQDLKTLNAPLLLDSYSQLKARCL